MSVDVPCSGRYRLVSEATKLAVLTGSRQILVSGSVSLSGIYKILLLRLPWIKSSVTTKIFWF